MGMNCAPWLDDLLFSSYENEFLEVVRSGHRRFAELFNHCHRYTDDLIVLNNRKFINYVKCTHQIYCQVYLSELNLENADRLDHQANYLDLTFMISDINRLYTKLYDKRDDIKFHTVNFPFL